MTSVCRENQILRVINAAAPDVVSVSSLCFQTGLSSEMFHTATHNSAAVGCGELLQLA